MVMDVWSRRILGVEVHGEQCGKLAGELFDRICRDEKINKESAAVLHSDNGAPLAAGFRVAIAITYISCKNGRIRNITFILKAKGQ